MVNRTEEQPSSSIFTPAIRAVRGVLTEAIILTAVLFLSYAWRKFASRGQDQIIYNLRSSQSDRAIDEELEKLLHKLNADRCVVGEFHTGPVFVSGKQDFSFTATHEATASGIKKISREVKDISGVYLRRELELLQENGWLFRSIRNRNIEPGCEAHLRKIGVEAVAQYLIRNYNEVELGILSVQFVRARAPVNAIMRILPFTSGKPTDQQHEAATHCAYRIGEQIRPSNRKPGIIHAFLDNLSLFRNGK